MDQVASEGSSWRGYALQAATGPSVNMLRTSHVVQRRSCFISTQCGAVTRSPAWKRVTSRSCSTGEKNLSVSEAASTLKVCVIFI